MHPYGISPRWAGLLAAVVLVIAMACTREVEVEKRGSGDSEQGDNIG